MKLDRKARVARYQSVPIPDKCKELMELHWQRSTLKRVRIANENRLRAVARRHLGFTPANGKADKKLLNRAEKIIKGLIKGSGLNESDKKTAASIGVHFKVILDSIAPIDQKIIEVERHMEDIAKTLPVFPWIESIPGVAACNFAKLIGETGDLKDFPNPSTVWKRLGLAPYKGKSMSTWRLKGGLTKDEWASPETGYKPSRRATSYQLMLGIILNGKSEFAKLYRERKVYELTKTDQKGIADKRARKFAEKRFIRELWNQWHGKTAPPSIH